MSRRRPRGLSTEDRDLWAFVTREVEPLTGRPRPAPPEPVAEAPAAKAVEVAPSGPASAKPKQPRPLPLAPFDRNERRRITRGTRSIDGRIDLHGMRQAEAHGALRAFLLRAQAAEHTVVLVITGKGIESDSSEERGVLRRMVPHWLRLPELRSCVVGFEEAHRGHGGGGALYVRLRRASRRRPA